jgi:hypothetical protein
VVGHDGWHSFVTKSCPAAALTQERSAVDFLACVLSQF